jgi:divalent metal cation (Fe/Co/Zn/Cd) transporter
MSTDAVRSAVRLEALTVAWNVLEVGVTIALGIAAGSLALVAFGLDSVIEICASVAVLWQLRTGTAGRTLRAMAVVGLAFFALAVILIGAAIETLAVGREAGESPLGAAYLAVTAIVMFSLATAKRRLGVRLGNHPLATEARITFLDGILATGVLLALVVNLAFGWWWADPIAAAVVGVAAIPEGVDAWRDSRDPSRMSGGSGPRDEVEHT